MLSKQGPSKRFVMRGFTLKTAARQVDPGELAAGHHPSDGPDSSSRASAAANANSASVPVLWIVCAILAILVVITGSIGLVIRAKCQSTRSSTSSSSNGGGKDATVHFTKKAPEVYGGQQATFRRSSHSMATVALTSSSPTHNNPDRNPDLIPDKGRDITCFTRPWIL